MGQEQIQSLFGKTGRAIDYSAVLVRLLIPVDIGEEAANLGLLYEDWGRSLERLVGKLEELSGRRSAVGDTGANRRLSVDTSELSPEKILAEYSSIASTLQGGNLSVELAKDILKLATEADEISACLESSLRREFWVTGMAGRQRASILNVAPHLVSLRCLRRSLAHWRTIASVVTSKNAIRSEIVNEHQRFSGLVIEIRNLSEGGRIPRGPWPEFLGGRLPDSSQDPRQRAAMSRKIEQALNSALRLKYLYKQASDRTNANLASRWIRDLRASQEAIEWSLTLSLLVDYFGSD